MSVFGDDELFEEFETKDENDNSESSSESGSGVEHDDQRDEKYNELLAENEKLRRTLRLLQRPANIKVKDSGRDGPVAHIILFNNHLSRKFKEEIQDFFCDLCTRRVRDSDAVPDIKQPFIQYLTADNEKAHKRSAKRMEASTKAFQGFSSIQVYDKFFIDHLGQPLYFRDPAHSDWFCPSYESVQFGPLSGDVDSAVLSKQRAKRICFNCGGSDHQIKDCEKPRDHQAINERRQKFMSDVAKYSQGSPQIRLDGPRYHKDDDAEDNKERFAKFKPGMISAELQEALGMKEDDLPPYVYQMRRLGYPPGHLHGARIVNSGLLLYEEGEINGRLQDNEYVPMDVEKIIGFPGFNLPPLPGQQDKFEKHGVGPINQAQSKEVMISYFEHRNTLYNQQKAVESQTLEKDKKAKRSDVVIEEVDMDVGEEEAGVDMHISNSDDDAVAEVEDGEVRESNVSEMEIVAEVGDLTEDELEVKRELLLKELQKSAANNNDSDYRNIKSNDQDYRIIHTEFHEIVSEDTPQSPEENTSQEETSTQDTVIVEEIIDLTNESDVESTTASLKRRSQSSDTDYRVPPPFELALPVHPDIGVESSAQPSSSEKVDVLTEDNTADDGDQRLPARQKFAEGISQFDMYFSESKSQGVYDKLRLLLKDSPRRQEK